MDVYKLTKSFVKTMYHSSRVLLRTVRVTLAEEVELSRARAKARYDDQQTISAQRAENATTPSLSESLQIIGVEDVKDAQRIRERYEHLFAANDRAKGGSFYLQSKVVRAKERIDKEMAALAEAQAQKAADEKETKSVKT